MARLCRAALLALAVAYARAQAEDDDAAPTPSPTKDPSFSADITRTDKMAYTLKMVDNDGKAIQYGTVDTTVALVSTATDAAATTVIDNYELTAGCYKLETFTTAVLTKYTRPELWSWHVGNQVAGYGFDAGIFGVGGELCGLPDCYSNCRHDTGFVNEWSTSNQCSNYQLLLKSCKCSAIKDINMLVQQLMDLGCTVPEPYIVSDNFGLPVKKITYIVDSHNEYNNTLSLLLINTAVPDSNIPRSFQTQVEGAGLATFLGVYPWSKVHLITVNGNPVDDVVTSRKLREEDPEGRRLQATTSRKLTRLTFSIDAYEKNQAQQQDRYAFLEAKPQDDFTALHNQLRSTVTLLKAPSTLMSTESYSKTREVVDGVTIDVEYLGPTPEPTPAPTPVGGYDDDDMKKPTKPVLVPTTQPPVSKSGGGGGGSGMGLYIGLAAAGLLGLGAAYCCIGGALRNKKAGKAAEEDQAARRAADDQAFRAMQAANAAKLAAANGPASGVPLD